MNSFKAALKSIRRSPYQALVAFLVTYIALFLVFAFSTFILVGNQVLTYYETQPQLIAFFKQEITDQTAQEVIAQLNEQPSLKSLVKDVKFVSKDEAVNFAKDSNKNDPVLVELITADILPASVEVSTHNPNDLPVVRDALLQLDQIEDVSFQEDVVEKFLHWTSIIRNSGLVVCSVLLILTFLVMNIVIGMKVVDHRQSIKIMQIIGATKFYIRKPYLIEGLIYGLISCVLAWSTMILVLNSTGAQLQSYFTPIMVFPLPFNFQLMQLGIGLGLAILISVVAAWRAVSRMIKRKP